MGTGPISAGRQRHWRSLELAKEAIELGARLTIAAALTGVPKRTLEQSFCDPDLPRSSCGRQPWSPYWYLRRHVIEIHAAVFHAGFRAVRALGYPPNEAFVTAYRAYLRHFGHDPRLSFDRAFELVTHLDGLWTDEAPTLMLITCTDCKSVYLAPKAAVPAGKGGCPFCRLVRARDGRALRWLGGLRVPAAQ